MNKDLSMTRRLFIGQTTAAALATTVGVVNLFGAARKRSGDPYRGLKMGITTYSLRKFSLDQAIAMTKEAGVKYISLKDMHLPLKSSHEQRQEARKKIKAAGLILTGCGVVYMKNNEDEIRNVFDYAKECGMPTITCSPDPDALDTVEKMAMSYNIHIAIHNHGPGDKKYPSPRDVLRMLKDRHKLMGICMDVGHTVRIGENPVEVIKECASRLYDFHMKDVSAATPKGDSVEVGKGVIDIPGVLKALLEIKYGYNVALEYEANGDNPMPGILGSYAYIRKVLAEM